MSYLLSLLNAAALVGALAALQALLLNRLRLAFAAIVVFSGLGGLAFAAQGPTGLVLIVIAIMLVFGFAWLAERLPKDELLLASLSALVTIGAIVGATPSLGGRTGLASGSAVGGPGFEAQMAPWTLGMLVLLIVGIRALLGSAMGIAIDRMGESGSQVRPFLPVARFRGAVMVVVMVAAFGVGALTVVYRGRVGADVFSVDNAVRVLTFSVVAGRRPELAALLALVDGVFPFLSSRVLPLSIRGAEEAVRIGWGLLVVYLAARQERR